MIKFILKNNKIIEYNKNDRIIIESNVLNNYFTHYKTIDYIHLYNIQIETMENIIEIVNGKDLSEFTKMELIDIINVCDFLDISKILKKSIKYYVLNYVNEDELKMLIL
jgi:hypothetical protein